MKFVFVVSFDHGRLELRELAKNPAVQAGQLVVRHGVFGRNEIVKVRKLVTQRVANHAVGFSDFVNPFFAHDDVVPKILRCHPEPHDVGAPFLHVGVRGLRFFVNVLALLALGNLFAVGIHHEAVCEHVPVRRGAIASE